MFRDVREAARIDCGYCMSWRSNIPIFVARGSIVPFEAVWPDFKHYE